MRVRPPFSKKPRFGVHKSRRWSVVDHLAGMASLRASARAPRLLTLRRPTNAHRSVGPNGVCRRSLRDTLRSRNGSLTLPTQHLFDGFGLTPDSRMAQDEIECALGQAGVGVKTANADGSAVRRLPPARGAQRVSIGWLRQRQPPLTPRRRPGRPRRRLEPPSRPPEPLASSSSSPRGRGHVLVAIGLGLLGLIVGLVIGASRSGTTKTATETVTSVKTKTVPGPVRIGRGSRPLRPRRPLRPTPRPPQADERSDDGARRRWEKP